MCISKHVRICIAFFVSRRAHEPATTTSSYEQLQVNPIQMGIGPSRCLCIYIIIILHISIEYGYAPLICFSLSLSLVFFAFSPLCFRRMRGGVQDLVRIVINQLGGVSTESPCSLKHVFQCQDLPGIDPHLLGGRELTTIFGEDAPEAQAVLFQHTSRITDDAVLLDEKAE